MTGENVSSWECCLWGAPIPAQWACGLQPRFSSSLACVGGRRDLDPRELGREPSHDPEARLPELGPRDVEAEPREEPVGGRAAAAREKLEVARHEGASLLAVELEEREHEELAERVRVTIEGRVDEVRDVAPPRVVDLGKIDRVAEERRLRRSPEPSEVGRRKPART